MRQAASCRAQLARQRARAAAAADRQAALAAPAAGVGILTVPPRPVGMAAAAEGGLLTVPLRVAGTAGVAGGELLAVPPGAAGTAAAAEGCTAPRAAAGMVGAVVPLAAALAVVAAAAATAGLQERSSRGESASHQGAEHHRQAPALDLVAGIPGPTQARAPPGGPEPEAQAAADGGTTPDRSHAPPGLPRPTWAPPARGGPPRRPEVACWRTVIRQATQLHRAGLPAVCSRGRRRRTADWTGRPPSMVAATVACQKLARL
mmetsp:Transcript_19608/g.59307  ORF Transcript_19608/g.59307 Transcript_19608/m.59307 type:complete len:261 (+) Transcript_19608:571-1353(+)